MKKTYTLKRAKRLLKIDETKLDRYLLYYANEIEYEDLTDTEKNMLGQYSQAWGMLRQGYPEDLVRTSLMKKNGIKERQSRYILEECKLLFGSIEEVDKEGRKRASIAYYDTLSNLSYNNKEYELAAKFRKMADELAGLYTPESLGYDPSDFNKPAKFIFMNDVKILNQQIEKDE